MRLSAGRLLLILVLSQLAACGFTLRDAGIDPRMESLYLNPQTGGGEMAAAVRRNLDNTAVMVIDRPGTGVPELRIGDEQSRERVVSVTSNARAGEYELTLTATFELRENGAIIAGPETVSTQSIYLADPENIAAKNAEADLLREEMRRELAAVILRRLGSIDP